MAKVYEKVDIFPKEPCNRVEKLSHYPKFGALLADNIHHFCLYMKDGKINFQKRDVYDKLFEKFKLHGKEAKIFNEFRPQDIIWMKVINGYKRSPSTIRTNLDMRTGYKVGDDYLVKANFTFGQRKVISGTAHVIQTLNVPLLFYLAIDKKDKSLKSRSFPYFRLHSYDRRILEPNRRYRIPAGTVYVLFSPQKNFFRVNLVKQDTKLPFQWTDPVAVRVIRIKEMYEEPVATPFIEEVNQKVVVDRIMPPQDPQILPPPTPLPPQDPQISETTLSEMSPGSEETMTPSPVQSETTMMEETPPQKSSEMIYPPGFPETMYQMMYPTNPSMPSFSIEMPSSSSPPTSDGQPLETSGILDQSLQLSGLGFMIPNQSSYYLLQQQPMEVNPVVETAAAAAVVGQEQQSPDSGVQQPQIQILERNVEVVPMDVVKHYQIISKKVYGNPEMKIVKSGEKVEPMDLSFEMAEIDSMLLQGEPVRQEELNSLMEELSSPAMAES